MHHNAAVPLQVMMDEASIVNEQFDETSCFVVVDKGIVGKTHWIGEWFDFSDVQEGNIDAIKEKARDPAWLSQQVAIHTVDDALGQRVDNSEKLRGWFVNAIGSHAI